MPNNVKIGTQATGVDKASSDLDRLRDKYAKLQKEGGKGLAIGAGAAIATTAIGALGSAVVVATDFIGNSITAASDLNETLSKSTVVFGKSAPQIEAWGKTAATALGMSENSAIGAAAGFGNLFKGLGETDAKSAEMSKALVGLAGDLASFNNIDPTEALDKLKSGLAGESEPLRSVGVFLTEAKVKAKAMAMGLGDAHGELSEGAKVMARYQLILSETTTAQGDFARTSDGMANQQRILSAELENTSAKLGTKLIPIVTEFQRTILYALDQSAMSFDRFSEAAAKGSQAAQGQLRLLEKAAQDNGVSAKDLYAQWQLTGGSFDDAAKQLKSATTSMEEHSGKMSDDLRSDAKAAGKAITSIGTAARTTAAESAREFARTEGTIEQFTHKLGDLANTALSSYFDPIINADRLLADEAALTAARRILASKTATAAEKRDATATIHSLEQSTTELRVKLALAGKLSKKEQGQLLKDLEADWKKATGAAKIQIANLIAAIQNIPTNVTTHYKIESQSSKSSLKPRASGGPVTRGEAYIVGENHPEVFVPDHDGTILPSMPKAPAGGGSWGGSSPAVQVTVNLGGGWTPASAEKFAGEVGPVLARWMQRQNIIPRNR